MLVYAFLTPITPAHLPPPAQDGPDRQIARAARHSFTPLVTVTPYISTGERATPGMVTGERHRGVHAATPARALCAVGWVQRLDGGRSVGRVLAGLATA